MKRLVKRFAYVVLMVCLAGAAFSGCHGHRHWGGHHGGGHGGHGGHHGGHH
ncbi:MAG: hypothetical protein AB1696_20520 [Planctomycetota bacterium]